MLNLLILRQIWTDAWQQHLDRSLVDGIRDVGGSLRPFGSSAARIPGHASRYEFTILIKSE